MGFLFLAGLLTANIGSWDKMTMPLVISASYALTLEICESFVWSRIAKRSPDGLTNFFMGVSVVRMLTALAMIFGYYLLGDKDSRVEFICVFALFYMSILMHHVAFSRKHSDTTVDE